MDKYILWSHGPVFHIWLDTDIKHTRNHWQIRRIVLLNTYNRITETLYSSFICEGLFVSHWFMPLHTPFSEIYVEEHLLTGSLKEAGDSVNYELKTSKGNNPNGCYGTRKCPECRRRHKLVHHRWDMKLTAQLVWLQWPGSTLSWLLPSAGTLWSEDVDVQRGIPIKQSWPSFKQSHHRTA